MEDVLAKIQKDTSPVKHATLWNSCKQSQELLAGQHELMRSPSHEIRGKCLETLRLALESKHSKLISHALNGLQRLVWDKSFTTIFEPANEELWLPLQLLNAVGSIAAQSDNVQIEILKIIVQLTSTSGYNLSSKAVVQVISLCIAAYHKGSTTVQTAAQATANQTLQAFCLMIQEPDVGTEEKDDDDEGDPNETSFNLLSGVIEDLFPILNFICKKLKSNSSVSKAATELLLQCILSILRNLNIKVHESQIFLNFLWQELCPRLVALLGSPKTDKNIVSSQKNTSSGGNQIGRGSGCLATAPSCQSGEAKTIFCIAVELVHLVGFVGSLRPVLESLFHRMLLYPPPQHRLEALKAVKELLHSPEAVLKFAGPSLYDDVEKNSRSSDLDLIRIAMDSLGECCHSSDVNVCYASVSCSVELLKSLEEICMGKKYMDSYADAINSTFKTLESTDVEGRKLNCWRERKDVVPEPPIIASTISSEYSESDLSDNENKDNENQGKDNEFQEVKPEFDKDQEIDQISTSPTNDYDYDNKEIKSAASHDNDEELGKSEGDDNEEKDAAVESEEANASVEGCQESVTDHEINDSSQSEKCPESPEVSDISSPSPRHLFSGQSSPKLVLHSDEFEIDKSPTRSNVHSPIDVIEDSNTSIASTPLDPDDSNILDDFEDPIEELSEIEANRLNKVPRTLLGQEDPGKVERERVELLCVHLEFAQQERNNAQNFVKRLSSFLPVLLSIRSSVEADQALQEFSSSYCGDLWEQQDMLNEEPESVLSHITILNADGIYLALYSSLLLNLKLIHSNYYKDASVPVPLTEIQFIEEVHGSGVLVYLSATWLAELYQQMLATNLLENAGYCPDSSQNTALVNLLSDVDGLGNSQPGGQQLADYRRLERAVANVRTSPNIEAGRKFARRILSCFWETVLEVLSVLLNGTNACGITSAIGFLLGTESSKEEHRKTRDAIAESLDGLQRTAKLCNALGLQSSCSAVFAQLAATSCPLPQDYGTNPQAALSRKDGFHQFKKSLLPGRNRLVRLHTSHALSMDVILSRGLELGSHSPSCWKFVFQCCLYVLELEKSYFSHNSGLQYILSRPTLQVLKKVVEKKSASRGDRSQEEDVDVQNLIPMPGAAIPQKLNISQLIQENADALSSGVIKDQLLMEVIEGLSQLVDRLFEEAAGRLNLSALIGFLVELCASSQIQLFNQNFRQHVSSSSHGNSLLLYHVGDIMLRCARSGRPLIHVMKMWSIIAPHFVEAACHKDHLISKKAVTTIHDIVSTLLSTSSELPYFHFNEALFKPFENMLCLELCDADVQEQIISSICEFVEGCTTDIRSGWRPLFGALRSVCLPTETVSHALSLGTDDERSHHIGVVLDVFEAFLGTDNILVFAYAAVDCLLCLLKHVKDPYDSSMTEPANNLDESAIPLDMCLASLKYLERCNSILASMYSMPTCPVFNSANRIQLNSIPATVDPNIADSEVIYFNNLHDTDKENASYLNKTEELEEDTVTFEPHVMLKDLDRHTGILHVWYLLFDGLAGAIGNCPKRYQPHTMETFFSMLRNVKETPGHQFGIYCINHLLLPTLQSWLRRISRIEKGWNSFAANYKQCCGLTTDLIVDYIQHAADTTGKSISDIPGGNLMLEQLFLVLTECISQPSETVSRLGCACIRHTILSAGIYFTDDMWEITCNNLQRACSITLQSIKQLMVCFHTDSESFYGDLVEVKVAARKDSTLQEAERLKQISEQVFLLDCQRGSQCDGMVRIYDDGRSYVFLLHPPVTDPEADPESSIIRVPFRKLVVCLLSHQILLQTLSTILLQGSTHLLPSLMTLLLFLSFEGQAAPQDSALPGFLSKLSPRQINKIFSCLKDSYKTACDFDARPGLKFLVQKVAQLDVAANLYKQTGVSWTAYTLALFELCISQKNLSDEIINDYILQQNFHDKLNTENSEQKSDYENNFLPSLYMSLMKKFKDICELYSECSMDRDGLLATVDRMTDQPIFFLVAQCDSISDLTSCDKQLSQDVTSKDPTDVPDDDSSDSDRPVVEDESKDRIYSLATEKTINSLINEYKKRKTCHSMPSTFREKLQRKSRSFEQSTADGSIPEEIIKQRRVSITKDGEAHVRVFKQLVQAILDLHLSLPNDKFKIFLPIFFPGIHYLVTYATDAEVKLILAEWLQRVAICCGFGGMSRNAHST